MKTSRCRESTCKAEFVWLVSAKDASKHVPVDLDSLNDDDIDALERREEVTFSSESGHVSHFTTCKAPRQFSKK